MSSDARKKEKKRLKRKQKQQELRKIRSRTPLSRIASEGGRLDCWVTRDWHKMGMADILVLGHAPGRRCAFAAFLVDLWCVGLKDTWGEAEITELEFRENVLDRWLQRTEGVKLDPATAKRLVLGGVRFSRQNGFKLPSHWDRWVSIFSPVGNIAEADITDFGKDGGLEYVGTAKFLRQRLIASTPEEFLRRADVKWMYFDGTPRGIEDLYRPDDSPGYAYDDDDYDEDDDDFDEEQLDEEEKEGIAMLDELTERMAEGARKWLVENGRSPSPRLQEGAVLRLATFFSGARPDDSEEELPPEVQEQMALKTGTQILSRYEDSEREEVLDAAGQINEFMMQFTGSAEMFDAVGLRRPPKE